MIDMYQENIKRGFRTFIDDIKKELHFKSIDLTTTGNSEFGGAMSEVRCKLIAQELNRLVRSIDKYIEENL